MSPLDVARRFYACFRDTLSVRNGLIVHSRLEFDAAEMRRRLTEAAVSRV